MTSRGSTGQTTSITNNEHRELTTHQIEQVDVIERSNEFILPFVRLHDGGLYRLGRLLSFFDPYLFVPVCTCLVVRGGKNKI